MDYCISVLNACEWLAAAWKEMKAITMTKCFVLPNFLATATIAKNKEDNSQPPTSVRLTTEHCDTYQPYSK